jgi:CRP/FNR family transcriptional regulator, cyclic AMP receptor protein
VHPQFKTAPLFTGLTPDSLELLSKQSQLELVPPICPIVSEGEPGKTLYLITSGIVRVVKSLGTPKEKELAKLGDGDFFGEMCILESLPRIATVQSLTETKMLSLTSQDILVLYETHPKDYAILLLNIARDLSRRLRHLDVKYVG